ncbi:D-erythronate dehydrogenase [Algihabitans albus]|uniref:D-erythronate dehydrogenase n=1 Tax=Algihabitans albus TaxID=2164067 RepID=UPI000E5D4D28|nr:D-erythronate dehydrogenase [Algihabitans albus]
MRVLVTGAGGFLGRQFVEDLARRGTVSVNGSERSVSRILVCDLATEPLADLAKTYDIIQPLAGPIDGRETLAVIAAEAPGLVVHLAAVVSSAAEADFSLGMQVNLGATLALIETLRTLPEPPVLLFASSVAVFSCAANEIISDTTQPQPRSSYGAQKLMGEILVRDASRKGFILGRSLRFPTIAVRPGKPNKAASSFASGILREPLAGLPADLPVGPDLRLHLASPGNARSALFHAAALRQDLLDGETSITLPGVSVSVGEMLATLAEIAGEAVAARVRPVPNAEIGAIVSSWPGGIETPRAQALGFAPDAGFEALLRAHMETVSEAA